MFRKSASEWLYCGVKERGAGFREEGLLVSSRGEALGISEEKLVG